MTALLRGGRWPGMSDRYHRKGHASGGTGSVAAESAPSERALWDALDEGTDPTVDPDPRER